MSDYLMKCLWKGVADVDQQQDAADRIEELEADRKKTYEAMLKVTSIHDEAEAKLAKAVEALELALELADSGLVDFSRHGLSCDADINKHYRTTLAELKGEK